jgi:thioredoxin reductase
MSRYLVERIAARLNVEVLIETTITALEGRDGVLEAIRYRSHRSGGEVRLPIRHLFLFVGAEPNTEWLSGSSAPPDGKGFLRTDGYPTDRSKPACPACSRSATCARDRSSVSPPLSARGIGGGRIARLSAEAGEGAALPTNIGRY